jgi:hypothetical protein
LSFAEIGNTMVDPEKLATVEAVIKTNPVENFDLARVVQVFSAYIQFFEFEVRGAQIQNQTVRLPKTLLSSIRDKATRERIIASFKLVASDSKVSGREVREKAAKIRKKFIHNHPIYGGVILKSVRIALDAEIAALQGLIDKHKQKVLGQFDRDAEKSIEELVKTFWRDIARNPPDDLSDQLGTGKRSTEEVKGYLRHVLRRAFPTADKIVEGMRVTQVIKDLTWATLNEPGFIDWLTKEFPLRKDLQRPFALFRAAQENTSGAADAD